MEINVRSPIFDSVTNDESCTLHEKCRRHGGGGGVYGNDGPSFDDTLGRH
jgi:hypothetical protein